MQINIDDVKGKLAERQGRKATGSKMLMHYDSLVTAEDYETCPFGDKCGDGGAAFEERQGKSRAAGILKRK